MRQRDGGKAPEVFGGRRNNLGVTEFERLIHLMASMQNVLGRRGCLIFPFLIVGLLVGGWFLYRFQFSPERALEQAHLMWDSNDSKEQIKAIRTYKRLLQKTDPIEPGRHWLMDDRDTLYRRIIRHEVIYTRNESKAAEWVLRAWDEGIRDLRFADERVSTFWDRTTESSRQKNKNRTRNQTGRFKAGTALNVQAC